MFLPDRLVKTRDLIAALRRYTAGIPRPASGLLGVKEKKNREMIVFIYLFYFMFLLSAFA